MRIDHQAHWYPEAFVKAMAERGGRPGASVRGRDPNRVQGGPDPLPLPPTSSDLEAQLEDLAAAGFDAMLSSPAVFGDVSPLEVPEAKELCLLVNEAYAQAQRDHPGQFFGLATIPLQEPEAAVEVLDEAILRQGLAGVLVHSNVDGRPICHPESAPVWDRIGELGVNVVLHPTRSVIAPAYGDWGELIDVSLGWLLDTSAAAFSLIVSGTLDRIPDLQVLHPHIGGVLPYLVGRLDGVARYRRLNLGTAASELPSAYLTKRFVVDSSTHTPGALRLAIDLYGSERVVFGSDSPYLPRADHVDFIQKVLAAPDGEQLMNARFPFRGCGESGPAR